ncbi:hypothetical protein [Flavobacterium daemonense]|uniref:hypothetical protein n=1 Tax=Flavobacterium daemonense TaxID=1393049 RepID=UPI0011848F78|nr:hypothetical protein [Flavobacterium daemonense]KAF2337220.1 hypothetical protein FND99_02065 [Flavobacterium daemonense]
MEADIYRWSAQKIKATFNYREFNKSLKNHPYSFGLCLNLERLKIEFLATEDYEYLYGIRDYLKRFE